MGYIPTINELNNNVKYDSNGFPIYRQFTCTLRGIYTPLNYYYGMTNDCQFIYLHYRNRHGFTSTYYTPINAPIC